jgi:AAA domain-containing protein
MRDNCAMALLRLIAEGIGPFERLDLDFSDGNGRPKLGPHILAGVNGSGKSTVLRAIAWALDQDGCGFDTEAWNQLTLGHDISRVLVIMRGQTEGSAPYALGQQINPWYIGYGEDLEQWAQIQTQLLSLEKAQSSSQYIRSLHASRAGGHPRPTIRSDSSDQAYFQAASNSTMTRPLASPHMHRRLNSLGLISPT